MIGNVQLGSRRLAERSLSYLKLGAIAVGALALNLAVGVGLGSGHTSLVIAAAVVLPAFLVLSNLIVAHRDWIVLAALLLTMLGGNLTNRLPGTGGTAIYPSDVFLALAVAGFLVERLTSRGHVERHYRLPFTMTWPLALFALTVLTGVVRGHQRYGTSYLSQPTRMILYALIVVAVSSMRMPKAYGQLVRVMYGVTIAQALIGAFHLATHTSQTTSSSLSTGGSRALALTTAMFLAAALVLALLNLEIDDRRRRWLHGTVAALALFGVVIALGRTTYAAVAVIVPVLLIGLRRVRSTLFAYAPLLAAVLAAAIALILQLDPSLSSTLSDRLNSHVSNDPSLIQRQRKFDAVLHGFGNEPLLGLGYGRPVTFTAIDGTEITFSGDPEDSYIYILAGGGILALAALIILMLSFFADSAIRMIRADRESRALIAFSMSFVFILLVNALSFPVLGDANLMLLLWIAILLPGLAQSADPARPILPSRLSSVMHGGSSRARSVRR